MMSRLESATDISSTVRTGARNAVTVVEESFKRAAEIQPEVNAITSLHRDRALVQAQAVDKAVAAGNDPGLLAGVPFAVKNLFDVQGETTLAGSIINKDESASNKDASLIRYLESAGAILVASVAMGEYAYDFTGENEHYGPCRNPIDPLRMSGGSSSGSAAVVAAGVTPLSLGSDTNGSIRVPSSLCGVFGHKPTYGRLSRAGSFPFCDSLDHLGPIAFHANDLATAFRVMDCFDADDPSHAAGVRSPLQLPRADIQLENMRVGILGGYFDTGDWPEAAAAIDHVAKALNAKEEVVLPGAEAGRAAAFLITNAEGGALHQARLQRQASRFDADTRYRFLAGSLLPSAWYVRAQRVRAWYAQQAKSLFQNFDLLLAPSTPFSAPLLGTTDMSLDGVQKPLRPNLGLFTQPISCIGLPVSAVPVCLPEKLPIGVQLIAAPWRDELCLAVAQWLETQDVCRSYRVTVAD